MPLPRHNELQGASPMKDICVNCPWAEQCHEDNDKTCILPEEAQEALHSNGEG